MKRKKEKRKRKCAPVACVEMENKTSELKKFKLSFQRKTFVFMHCNIVLQKPVGIKSRALSEMQCTRR